MLTHKDRKQFCQNRNWKFLLCKTHSWKLLLKHTHAHN